MSDQDDDNDGQPAPDEVAPAGAAPVAGEDKLMDVLRALLAGSRPDVFQQVAALTWSGMEVLEHADRLLFPEKIRRVRKDGTVEETEVRLRVPRPPELRKARVTARQMCAEDGVDPKLDPDLLKDLEDICILQAAVRSPTDPYEPLFGDPRAFEKKYDKPVLAQLLQKVDALIGLVDPRPETITADECVAMIVALARERSIRPLAAYSGAAQRSFIITTAQLLATSLGLRYSPASSAPSTQEPSTQPS